MSEIRYYKGITKVEVITKGKRKGPKGPLTWRVMDGPGKTFVTIPRLLWRKERPFYDPRKIPPREEQVCECGKTYFNFMSYMRHRINCETVFIKMLGKLVVNEDGSPVAVSTKMFTQTTLAGEKTK